MVAIYTLDQIKKAAEDLDFTQAIEQGFIAYSKGQVVVPPVGELVFENPPGDTHIKYGYIKNDDYFVIKVASGFYQNTQLGLPSSSGLMLVFSQKTGVLDSILIDEGFLTNARTAIAGKIVASYMAPKNITAIGVFGTGIMARMQVQYLKSVTSCNRLIVWGRSNSSLHTYKDDMEKLGYEVTITTRASDVTKSCNLIIMTTPSVSALVNADQIRSGTHITAMGSDTAEKQELDEQILADADMVVTDSLEQSQQRGEVYKAIEAGKINLNQVVELGAVIESGKKIRQSDEQVTVADLTGVAVQDIQIAKAICNVLNS